MKTINRISLCVLLAFSFFVTAGCSDTKKTDPAPSTSGTDDAGSDEKPADGSDAK